MTIKSQILIDTWLRLETLPSLGFWDLKPFTLFMSYWCSFSVFNCFSQLFSLWVLSGQKQYLNTLFSPQFTTCWKSQLGLNDFILWWSPSSYPCIFLLNFTFILNSYSCVSFLCWCNKSLQPNNMKQRNMFSLLQSDFCRAKGKMLVGLMDSFWGLWESFFFIF